MLQQEHAVGQVAAPARRHRPAARMGYALLRRGDMMRGRRLYAAPPSPAIFSTNADNVTARY